MIANFENISSVAHTQEAFAQAFRDNLYYTRGQAIYTATARDLYTALAITARDYMMYYWQQNVDCYFRQNPKFVYYLSAEYLLGAQLEKNLLYTGTDHLARETMRQQEIDLDELIALDIEPGLGNGGLGRLSACFMDSLATLNIPAVGYGIRYEYGIFRQSFHDGWQVESPDEWLYYGNPWEFPQPDDMVEVGFGGYTESYTDSEGKYRVRWQPAQTIMGQPYHTLVPGYKTKTVNMLRLWSARATREFDLQLFDVGDYSRAVEQKTSSENVSKVLYPNDNTPQGKELRLKQQYFFVACSLNNIIKRFKIRNAEWEELPNVAVIHLNDSHPVIAIAELMRLLMDEYGLGWERAWRITTRAFAATQHTLLPEALEKWPVSLLEHCLPRHLEIIYEINHRFLAEVRMAFPNDIGRARRMSIIEEGAEKQVRMANLACVGSYSVNGVAKLQSDLLQARVFPDFAAMYPDKFGNKTNGVTPRRFMKLANPQLAALITERIGAGWLTNLEELAQLEATIDDERFRTDWRAVKRANKAQLAEMISGRLGLTIDLDSLFDVMVKRLHEYKRQLLKTLHIIHLYQLLKRDPAADIAPTTFVFGAKAAPGYHMAKLIIKLINAVADVVNRDPVSSGRLRVVFIPNFNVTSGQLVYPAADLSEQISLAGKEASGTGNMKFALNGALTIGTLDGANIEIRERVGAENFFLFGMTTDEVHATRQAGYNPRGVYESNADLREAIDWIAGGVFSSGDSGLFQPIVDSLLHHDEYMLCADFASYLACQRQVAAAFADEERWTTMSILNCARSGFFSSDRTIAEYNRDIWRASTLDISRGD
ncbi:MAG: glycogen/starch/alpha-glucan phosphorylase [Chloroflexi bacterium]|nr:glycogen/starch/alpha-glucan phosphorylase [Chloroflexota bacterium]MCY3581974.1 glycogen/starch/alpha-glucan phosphorylase [Chloroflexota bacterium]MCY3715973.1 glycogen/starch/alpha-glucan phosphorylase [Chloroflexota bacterium]MDE2651544.1 glycogen/starch/alpha-glucan phosphorylase [Chloroflexota bacterium]MYA93342.1 glycogen/starch/alpha-glucan phosphorylase [Chloroflexota bacterium]